MRELNEQEKATFAPVGLAVMEADQLARVANAELQLAGAKADQATEVLRRECGVPHGYSLHPDSLRWCKPDGQGGFVFLIEEAE